MLFLTLLFISKCDGVGGWQINFRANIHFCFHFFLQFRKMTTYKTQFASRKMNFRNRPPRLLISCIICVFLFSSSSWSNVLTDPSIMICFTRFLSLGEYFKNNLLFKKKVTIWVNWMKKITVKNDTWVDFNYNNYNLKFIFNFDINITGWTKSIKTE